MLSVALSPTRTGFAIDAGFTGVVDGKDEETIDEGAPADGFAVTDGGTSPASMLKLAAKTGAVHVADAIMPAKTILRIIADPVICIVVHPVR